MLRKKMIGIGIVSVVFIMLIRPAVEDFWTRFRDFTDPHYTETLRKHWDNKSTGFLIGKMQHQSYQYSGVATSLLRDRRDISNIGKIIHIIQHGKSTRSKSLALSILFFWDEKMATDMAMEFIVIGRDHPLFDTSAGTLSYRKYDPAYPYVLELTKSDDKYRNGSASYLGQFGKVDALPVLEEMLKSAPSRLHASIIRDAIKSIKEQSQKGSVLET